MLLWRYWVLLQPLLTSTPARSAGGSPLLNYQMESSYSTYTHNKYAVIYDIILDKKIRIHDSSIEKLLGHS